MCKAKAGYASKTQALFIASYQPFPENQASIIFTLDFFHNFLHKFSFANALLSLLLKVPFRKR